MCVFIMEKYLKSGINDQEEIEGITQFFEEIRRNLDDHTKEMSQRYNFDFFMPFEVPEGTYVRYPSRKVDISKIKTRNLTEALRRC